MLIGHGLVKGGGVPLVTLLAHPPLGGVVEHGRTDDFCDGGASSVDTHAAG